MKNIFPFLICLLFSNTVASQPWEQVYPKFPTDDITSLIHWNGDTLFAAGTDFLFMKSVDKGRTWQRLFQTSLQLSFRAIEKDKDFIYLLPTRILWEKYHYYDTLRFPLYRYNPYTGDTTTIFVPILYPDYHGSLAFFWTDISVSERGIGVLEETRRVAILSSTDQGVTWSEMQIPDSLMTNYYGNGSIYFRDKNTCAIINTVVGDQYRRLFITQNGGITWVKAPSIRYSPDGTALSKWAGKWITDSIAVFINDGYQSVVTTDRGSTWRHFGNTNLRVTGIDMNERGIGYAVGNGTEIAKTTDFGATWIMVKNPIRFQGNHSCVGRMKDEQTFVAGSDRGYIYSTIDGGRTWEGANESELYNIGNIDFFSLQEGACEANDLYDGRRYYYRSLDGGLSWIRTYPLSMLGSAFSIKNVSASLSFALRYNNDEMLYRTTDKGHTWETVYAKQPTDSIRLEANQSFGTWIDNATTVCVLTNSGLLRSTNLGTSWTVARQINQVRPTTQVLKLETKNPGIAWMLFEKQVLQTTDYGTNWISITTIPDSFPQFKDLYALNRDTFYVKANKVFDYILKTTDGGTSWNIFRANSVSSRETLYHNRSGFGFSYELFSPATNRTITMATTEDEWKNYRFSVVKNTRANSPTFNDYSFLDQQNGWLAGYNFIMRTSNGGIDWIEQPKKISGDFSLSQSYPNPATSITTIPFEITSNISSSDLKRGIKLVVYDLLGREVAAIARDQLEVGKNQISFDASRLQAGVYCYRLMVGEQAVTRKMVVVR